MQYGARNLARFKNNAETNRCSNVFAILKVKDADVRTR